MQFPVRVPGGTPSENQMATADQIEAYVESLAAWKFLGGATLGAAAARTSDVIWTGSFNCLLVKYWISGYAGNAIGRIILGSGSLSETATDCSCELIEGTTRTTTAVNICGWPTATSLNTNPRYGWFTVFNESGASQARRAFGDGMHGGAVGTVPTRMQMSAFKNTVAQMDRARMTSFNAITGNTVGSNLNAGSNIKVWGLKD
jgi:hypothetical protein